LILKMAWISESEEVMIIAAAGSDANHGFSGVETSPCLIQSKIEIVGMKLVLTLLDPRKN
jgi:hypothetical protein